MRVERLVAIHHHKVIVGGVLERCAKLVALVDDSDARDTGVGAIVDIGKQHGNASHQNYQERNEQRHDNERLLAHYRHVLMLNYQF